MGNTFSDLADRIKYLQQNSGHLIVLKGHIYDQFFLVPPSHPPLPNQPRRHLLVQKQQWKQQKNVWNLFKLNNKDNSDVFINFEHILQIVLAFPLLTLRSSSESSCGGKNMKILLKPENYFRQNSTKF